jgi:hypothetical protein
MGKLFSKPARTARPDEYEMPLTKETQVMLDSRLRPELDRLIAEDPLVIERCCYAIEVGAMMTGKARCTQHLHQTRTILGPATTRAVGRAPSLMLGQFLSDQKLENKDSKYGMDGLTSGLSAAHRFGSYRKLYTTSSKPSAWCRDQVMAKHRHRKRRC